MPGVQETRLISLLVGKYRDFAYFAFREQSKGAEY
jgi:hypothetical protein